MPPRDASVTPKPPAFGSQGRIRNLIELNVAVLLFGGTSLFAKLIDLPVTSIIFGRSAVAAIALLAYLGLRRFPIRPMRGRDFLVLVGTGAILAAHWVAYFRAIQVSTVAIGTIALHTYPIITVLAEPVVNRTRLRLADALLATVVLIGIVILVPEFSLNSNATRGVLWGVLAAVTFTARNLVVRRHIQRYPAATIMFHQTFVSAILLLPVVGFTGSFQSTLRLWPVFLLVGTVFTAVTQTLYASSLHHLSAKTVSIVASLLPLYSTIFAALILGEIPAVRTVIGGVVVMGAVLIETIRVASGRPSERTTS